MQTTFFHLGKFLKKLADNQCSSISKGSIYYIKHKYIQPFSMEGDWPEIYWNALKVNLLLNIKLLQLNKTIFFHKIKFFSYLSIPHSCFSACYRKQTIYFVWPQKRTYSASKSCRKEVNLSMNHWWRQGIFYPWDYFSQYTWELNRQNISQKYIHSMTT